MPYVIAEPCVDTKDTACVEVCPVDCLPEQWKHFAQVDADWYATKSQEKP